MSVVLLLGTACPSIPTEQSREPNPDSTSGPIVDPFDPQPSSPDEVQGGSQPTDDEIAAILSVDSDNDGATDLEELASGGDPNDPTDGPDIDGDGILNGSDPDVDGDGLDNGVDPDVDGDGRLNGFDDDIDGDGLLEAEDDDDDGDGIPDLIDNDDNGDGEDDCGCEHGVCSAFGGLCFCDRGWEGEDCDEFHCRDVRNCNHGKCVGPNTCRCDSGWESIGSIPCATFHCRQLKNCNRNGFCIGPNVCRCDADWQGLEDCSIHTCDRNPMYCDDGDPCTEDVCNPAMGCSHTPIMCTSPEECVNGTCTTRCTNASACMNNQGCRDGGCFECENDADCRDGDPCTTDLCDPLIGCTNQAKTCGAGEECVRGACVTSCMNDSECGNDAGGMPRKCSSDNGCFDQCDDGECGDEEVCDDGICVPEDQEEDQP
ncbi:MAG: hypothetical protein J5J06_06350 [Phycisphaerae bacterium]|nr:hypothetical protein [Phycisphaerae bacterium]